MQLIASRARALRSATRKSVLEKVPGLIAPVPVRRDDRAIILGRNEYGAPVRLPLRARLEHTHLVGTTGGGKTKYIEHSARQDIIDGRGVCLVDPHGNHPDSLYRSMLCWLQERGYTQRRVVHLIDPNAPTHVTGINPLELPSADYQATVIAEAMQEALERMWGEEDMNAKPTMQRVLSALLTALTELKLTLAETRLLFDPEDRDGIRSWTIANLCNEEAREELQWLHDIASEPRGRQDFRQEIMAPRNRLAKLTRDDSIRLMVGQRARTIDFRAALDEGHIILANLSPGPRAGDKATQLLGRLLTRSIFFHAVRRQRPERPFFLYLDECHLYLSGDISRMLAEARKYGLGVLLAHQALAQLETAGLDILEAVKNTTNIKVVLRIKDMEEATQLADMVLRYDLEMPVHSLIKPTLVGHRLVRLNGESASEQFATTEMHTRTEGKSVTESQSYTHGESSTIGESSGTSESESLAASHGVSSASMTGNAVGMSTGMQLAPDNGTFVPGAVLGTSQGETAQSHEARSSGTQAAQSRSSGKTLSTGASSAQTTSESWTQGTAVSHSESVAVGKATTRGHGKSAGWQEAFESILEDRPTAVHGLENIRYMAATVLRNLTAGRAAISFVDATGMKTAALTVANVESYAPASADFDAVRAGVLGASPSATPIDRAIANVASRHSGLKALAAATQRIEPETVEGFRNKRRRPLVAEPTVELHGERSAPERAPVKGRDRLRRRP
jgi:hypothetical protein